MDNKFMDAAFEEAKIAFELDEVPIGAVIVENNKIIAKGHNMKEHDMCCISHAEINAILSASNYKNNWRLDNCDIYVTLDPCPMCASAIKQARIKNVYSANKNKYVDNEIIISKIFQTDSTNPSVNFISNINVDKSEEKLKDFFEKQRSN